MQCSPKDWGGLAPGAVPRSRHTVHYAPNKFLVMKTDDVRVVQSDTVTHGIGIV